jgi:hypothetical protein
VRSKKKTRNLKKSHGAWMRNRQKTACYKNTEINRFFKKQGKTVNRREALILKGAGSAAPMAGKPQDDTL